MWQIVGTPPRPCFSPPSKDHNSNFLEDDTCLAPPHARHCFLGPSSSQRGKISHTHSAPASVSPQICSPRRKFVPCNLPGGDTHPTPKHTQQCPTYPPAPPAGAYCSTSIPPARHTKAHRQPLPNMHARTPYPLAPPAGACHWRWTPPDGPSSPPSLAAPCAPRRPAAGPPDPARTQTSTHTSAKDAGAAAYLCVTEVAGPPDPVHT